MDLIEQAVAAPGKNIYGSYVLKKDGKPLSGFDVLLLDRVGESALVERGELLTVAKRCVNGNVETMSGVSFRVGPSLVFRVVQVEATRLTVEVQSSVGEQVGTGTYSLDGCEATGPIVRTVAKALVYDLANGEGKEQAIGNGYTLEYTVRGRDEL